MPFPETIFPQITHSRSRQNPILRISNFPANRGKVGIFHSTSSRGYPPLSFPGEKDSSLSRTGRRTIYLSADRVSADRLSKTLIIGGDIQTLRRRVHLSLSLILCACSNIHLSDLYRRVQLSVQIFSDPHTSPIIVLCISL